MTGAALCRSLTILPLPSARTQVSHSDPRIDQSVGQVDSEVDQHVEAGENQDHALDDGIVALGNGVHHEPAHAGDVEHRLGDDDATDQQCDADADDGQDRHASIPERVLQMQRQISDAFCARGADVVLGEHVSIEARVIRAMRAR